MSLPTSITGVRLVDGKASVASVPLPALDGDKVLVKIAAAPINPSDVMWLKGDYPADKDKVAFAGLAGSGVVIATGPDATGFKGKRVSFFVGSGDQGTWADYAVVKASDLIPLPDAIDDEQAAAAPVNPFTAELFLVECEKAGHKAIVHNAAAGALGQMVIAVAKKGGKVKVINLVRHAENVATLKDKGAEYVIDTTVDGWEDEFSKLAKELKPSAYFDPVAGSAGSKVIHLMPEGSTIYTYGGLGDAPSYEISLGDILFQYKTIRGMWLSRELKNPELAKQVITNALTNLASKTYQTTIYKKYPFAQFEEALKDYEANASKGKILLVPGN